MFLKGILIGLIFGVPVGAVGAMTIVMFMGIRLLFRKGEAAEVPVVSGKVRMFLSSFAVGITNPAAILTFLFAFSWFGIAGDNTKAGGWLVVLGVFVGTYLWWGGLAAAVALARKKKRVDSFRKMNRIFGVVLSLFGILVFIRNYVKKLKKEQVSDEKILYSFVSGYSPVFYGSLWKERYTGRGYRLI